MSALVPRILSCTPLLLRVLPIAMAVFPAPDERILPAWAADAASMLVERPERLVLAGSAAFAWLSSYGFLGLCTCS
jgi:hypothetical protein